MREVGAQVGAPDIVPGQLPLPCPLGSGSSAARGHPLGPGVSLHYPEAHRPRKVPWFRRSSGRCKVSVAAQMWLRGTRRREEPTWLSLVRSAPASRAGPRGRAQRDQTPPVEGFTHHSTGDMRVGRSRACVPTRTSTPSPRPRPDWAPAQPAASISART